MFRLVVVSCLLALALGASVPKGRKALKNHRPIFPSGRIVGGEPTPIEDVPYQIALERERDGFQLCGGSLIAPDTVLCSGQCVINFKPEELTVRTGSSKHEDGGTLVQVQNITIHPKYDNYHLDYDVSIVKLAKAIELGPGSALIAPANYEPANGDVLVSGWGKLSLGGEHPDTLYSVVVPIVDRATCEKAHATLSHPITARMICGGEAGKDSCNGDNGGPVVLGSGDAKVQVGIVADHFGCADPGYPGVYTNVADKEIRSFIKEQTGI